MPGETVKEMGNGAAPSYKELIQQWTTDSQLGNEEVKEVMLFVDNEEVVELMGWRSKDTRARKLKK